MLSHHKVRATGRQHTSKSSRLSINNLASDTSKIQLIILFYQNQMFNLPDIKIFHKLYETFSPYHAVSTFRLGYIGGADKSLARPD